MRGIHAWETKILVDLAYENDETTKRGWQSENWKQDA